MKKVFLTFSLIALFALYTAVERGGVFVLAKKPPSSSAALNIPTTSGALTPTPQAKSSSSKTNIPTKPITTAKHVSTLTTKPRGMYTDGMYVGSVADAYYGNVEVQSVIAAGKLTDVVFLQYPNERSYSIEINQQAMPYLKKEAIAAQSANVDIVSGATLTSRAFRESLAVALAKTHNF